LLSPAGNGSRSYCSAHRWPSLRRDVLLGRLQLSLYGLALQLMVLGGELGVPQRVTGSA
jgi:hypothetical protein